MYMGMIAQGELVGSPFHRNLSLQKHGTTARVPQTRVVRIAALLDETTGKMAFHPVRMLPFAISQLHRIPLASGRLFDRAWQSPTLETARKAGASSPGVDIEAVIKSRGGNDQYRIPKTGGFALSATRREIAAEGALREKPDMSQAEVLRIAPSLRGPLKKGGFALSTTAAEIRRERKRKQKEGRPHQPTIFYQASP